MVCLDTTGVSSNLAIEGNGFFVVKNQGQTLYTRAGNFQLDNNSNLIDGSGAIVQGYGVDKNFNIVNTGTPQDITIPLNSMTLAEATKNVEFSGNLDANGAVAVNGSEITGNPLYADATQTTPATATTPLSSLYDAAGNQLFTTGDNVTLSGATKDSATLPDATFQVGASSTLGDLTNFMQGALGIDTTVPGTTAGVTVQNGAIQINGNTGTVNDLDLSGATITKNGDTTAPLDLTFNKTQSADGESVRTTFQAYDSLGTPMTMDLSVVLESKGSQGSTWRFYVQNADTGSSSNVLDNGTIGFDTSGQYSGSTGNVITVSTLQRRRRAVAADYPELRPARRDTLGADRLDQSDRRDQSGRHRQGDADLFFRRLRRDDRGDVLQQSDTHAGAGGAGYLHQPRWAARRRQQPLADGDVRQRGCGDSDPDDRRGGADRRRIVGGIKRGYFAGVHQPDQREHGVQR